MDKFRFVSNLILVPFIIILLIGGCGGGGTAQQKLVINANGPLTIDNGQSLQLTAAETNAAARTRAGEGMASRVAAATAAVSVTWAIKSGPGTLTSATSTSVTFCAGTLSGANCTPLTLTSSAQTVITATSTTNANETQSVTITTTPPPSVTTTSLTVAVEFATYTMNLTETGGAGTLKWSMGTGSAALPSGLILDPSGKITGAATGPNGTTTNIILKVTDSGNPNLSASSGPLSLTVNLPPAPTLTPASGALPGGTEGTAYPAQTITVSNGHGPFAFSIINGTLPAGLTPSSSGTMLMITGTPTGPPCNPCTFSVKVTDSSNPSQSATNNYSIVVSLPPPPTITSTSPLNPAATVGVAYNFTFAASGAGPFSWAAAPALTNGLAFNANGTVTGTPTAPPTTLNFNVTVTDKFGQSSAATAFKLVISFPAPPTITSTSPLNPAATIGVAYNFTFTANGASPFTWAAAPALTNGLTFNANGTITGTPSTPATTLNFNVTVTDKFGQSSAATPFMLVISATPPITVTITMQPASSVPVNGTTSATAHVANDASNLGLDWTLSCGLGGPAACGSITAHTASDAAAAYRAPAVVPLSTVTMKATSTADNTKFANANPVTITAATACNPGATTLCGRFTLLAQGSPAGSLAPVMTAATFTADGNGGVTDGRISFNSDSLQFDDMTVTPVASTAWTVGADGRGSITLTTSTAINGSGKIKFTFALNAAGTFAFIFESDDTTGTGLHQSGYMQAADKTKFNAASISGGYALGLVGGDGAGSVGRPRAAMLAGISASGTDCGITSNGNSVFIIHDQGAFNASPISFVCTTGGLTTIDATTGHGNVQITFTGSPFSSQVMNFALYVIDATKVIFISIDAAGANFAILSGTAYKQAKSSFTVSDLACGFAPDTNSGCVFALSGESGAGSHVSAGRAVGTASGMVTIQSDDNKAGTLTSTTTSGNAVTLLNASAGLGIIGGTAGVVLIGTDDGIIGIPNGAEQVGRIRPQTTKTISTSQVTFILGSRLPADGIVGNASGVVTLAKPSAGNFSGTVDVEEDSSPFEVPNFAFTGTYVLDSPATGRGTGTSNVSGLLTIILWSVSPNEVIVLDSQAGIAEPVLLDLMKQ